MSKKIEVYYSSKSKTLYVMLPDGSSYYVMSGGHVGQTYGTRNVIVHSKSGDGSMENAKLVCELTPSVIRKVSKVLVNLDEDGGPSSHEDGSSDAQRHTPTHRSLSQSGPQVQAQRRRPRSGCGS